MNLDTFMGWNCFCMAWVNGITALISADPWPLIPFTLLLALSGMMLWEGSK